jgi:hypothetical protein
MNNSKILTMGCAVAIAVAPFSVKAASLKDGLDACASAVVSELASSSGAPLDYSMSEDSHASKSRLAGEESGQRTPGRTRCGQASREPVNTTRCPVGADPVSGKCDPGHRVRPYTSRPAA